MSIHNSFLPGMTQIRHSARRVYTVYIYTVKITNSVKNVNAYNIYVYRERSTFRTIPCLHNFRLKTRKYISLEIAIIVSIYRHINRVRNIYIN